MLTKVTLTAITIHVSIVVRFCHVYKEFDKSRSCIQILNHSDQFHEDLHIVSTKWKQNFAYAAVMLT
jgi:hypothetical protein